MPYICLIQDLPDGALQITDLWPNSSSKNNSIDPPGQTRYVNRVKNDPIHVGPNGKLIKAAEGLGAYIADTIRPDTRWEGISISITVQRNKINLVGVGDWVSLWGQKFTCVEADPDKNEGEFLASVDARELVDNLMEVLTQFKGFFEDSAGMPVELVKAEGLLPKIDLNFLSYVPPSKQDINLTSGTNGGPDNFSLSNLAENLDYVSWFEDTPYNAPQLFAEELIRMMDAGETFTLETIHTAFDNLQYWGEWGPEQVLQSGHFDVRVRDHHPEFTVEGVLQILSGRSYSLGKGTTGSGDAMGSFGPEESFTHTVDGEAFEHSFEHGQISKFRKPINTIYPNRLGTYHNASPSMKTKGAPRPKKDVALIVVYNDDGTVKTDLG